MLIYKQSKIHIQLNKIINYLIYLFMLLFKRVLFLFSILILTGCASFYRSVKPETISYPVPSVMNEKVELSYRYDVLRDAGNKKFVKSELRKNMKIVAVKLTNNTDATINVEKDLSFYCGSSKVLLLSPLDIKAEIKQAWPAYSLYLIGCLTTAPLDIAVFGTIGIGNMLVAGDANKRLLTELTQYDIRRKDLRPGESLVGLIGFKALYGDPLSIKLNN